MKSLKKYLLVIVLFVSIMIFPKSVLAGEYGSYFDRILKNGRLVINSIPPTEETFNHIVYELPFYNVYGKYLYSDIDGYFGVSNVSSDYKHCTIDYMDENTYQTIESQDVDIVYNYDENILAKINKYVEKLPAEKEYYEISDMELINFWINGKKDNYENIDNYSSELKQYFDNTNLNFHIDNRAGLDNEFLTLRIGIATISYGGSVYYVDNSLTTRAASIIYVPNDAEDIVQAAEDRINEYVGDGDYEITRVGLMSDYINTAKAEIEAGWHEDYEEAVEDNNEEISNCQQYNSNDPGYCDYLHRDYINYLGYSFDYFEEFLFLEDYEDYDYYKITINDIDRYFMIEKNSEKMNRPTYSTSDIETNILIDSDVTSIPLDSVIESEQITSEDNYNKITDLLGKNNTVTYDINLYSKSIMDYITKLDNGKFKVSIPIPDSMKGQTLTVYYIDEDDNVEEHEVSYEGNYAVFETDHFSTYTLAGDNIKNPKTYDDVVKYFIILGISVVLLVGYFVYVKKKN